MYVKIDGQLKTIKGIELTSDSKTILLHIETETGKEEVYNCPSGSPIYYLLPNSLPRKFIFRATLFAETRISLSR